VIKLSRESYQALKKKLQVESSLIENMYHQNKDLLLKPMELSSVNIVLFFMFQENQSNLVLNLIQQHLKFDGT
jgi:hypothetical protein